MSRLYYDTADYGWTLRIATRLGGRRWGVAMRGIPGTGRLPLRRLVEAKKVLRDVLKQKKVKKKK